MQAWGSGWRMRLLCCNMRAAATAGGTAPGSMHAAACCCDAHAATTARHSSSTRRTRAASLPAARIFSMPAASWICRNRQDQRSNHKPASLASRVIEQSISQQGEPRPGALQSKTLRADSIATSRHLGVGIPVRHRAALCIRWPRDVRGHLQLGGHLAGAQRGRLVHLIPARQP